MNRHLPILTALLIAAPAWAAAGDDEAVIQLATGAGCMTCHHIEPGAKGRTACRPSVRPGATWPPSTRA
ncbi:MAG: hypothetical protein MUF44_11760 [Hydrogenophaga sp.]|jgi:cytochrome c|nr:hypothetical protein [Hydrogenophaga sp.]